MKLKVQKKKEDIIKDKEGDSEEEIEWNEWLEEYN